MGVADGAWTEAHNLEWPPLAGQRTTLRTKIPKDRVAEVLEGEYRMYCKPDGGDPFSYGLIVRNVDVDAATFEGGSRVEGKYEVENGKLRYEEKTARLFISYDEVWPGNQRDCLTTRVKSNSKFQCESTGGYEQKASNEEKNLPTEPALRVGTKYFLGDPDAAAS